MDNAIIISSRKIYKYIKKKYITSSNKIHFLFLWDFVSLHQLDRIANEVVKDKMFQFMSIQDINFFFLSSLLTRSLYDTSGSSSTGYPVASI